MQLNWLNFAVEPIITQKIFLLCAAAKCSLSLDSLDSRDALGDVWRSVLLAGNGLPGTNRTSSFVESPFLLNSLAK